MNPISISAAPTTKVIQKRYYDLPGTIEFWKNLVVAMSTLRAQ